MGCSRLQLAEMGFGFGQAVVFGAGGKGIALFFFDLVLRFALFRRCVTAQVGGIAAGLGRFHLDIGICLGCGLRGFGFLDAHIFGVAGQIVALLFGHCVCGFCLRNPYFVMRLQGWFVAVIKLGLGNVFLAFGLGHTNVFGIAGDS